MQIWSTKMKDTAIPPKNKQTNQNSQFTKIQHGCLSKFISALGIKH